MSVRTASPAATATGDKRSLAGMASPLVIGRVASMAVTFALPLALARLLDASAFGAYKQLFLVAQTALLACQLGLTQSLYFFIPREQHSDRSVRGAYVGHAVLGLGSIGLVMGALLYALGSHVTRHLGGGELDSLVAPLALLASAMLCAAPLEPALTSEGRVGAAGLAYVMSDGTRAAMLLAGARMGGLHGVAWAGTLWALGRVVALGLLVATSTIEVARPDRARLREQLGYALPFAGSVLLFVAQRQFVQYAVAASFDAATFALFSVAAFHMPVVDIVYTPICEVLMVQLGRGRGSCAERLAAWDDAVEKLATLLFPAAACAFLFGPTVLPLLFTHRYAAAVPLFLLTSIEIPLWALPVDGLLRAAGRTRFLFGWYAIRIVLTAAGVTAGMHLFGVAGAIGGGIAVEVVSRVVMAAAGRSILDVPLGRVIDPSLARLAFAAAAAAAPAWVVFHQVASRAGDKVAVIAGGSGYLVAYGALFFALRRPPRASAAPAATVAA